MGGVIELSGVTKRYGERVGIVDVSLDVPEGCVFGFIGPNGAGKTTTIRILMGFLRATAGRARVLGVDCWRESHVAKRDIGYVPGDLRLYSWMTGRDAIAIAGSARGLDLGAPGRDLAECFELDLSVQVRSMSRGMRQKLGLILALAHRPRLLVLDEPTSALDPITQDRLYQSLRELAGDGHSIFFSSHVLSEVEGLCDRVAIVREGRIVADEQLEVLRGLVKRAVQIEWDGRAPERGDAPAFLDVVEANGNAWRCELGGEAPQLLAWLDGRGVRDLVIQPPDLDSVFRSYYEAGADR